MQHDNTIHARDILKDAKVVLLVDWPNPDLPRTLLEAGFAVFCYSPNGFTKAEIVAEYPHDVNDKNIFPRGNKTGFLVFRPMGDPPPVTDIANIFRAEQEHASIITNVLLELNVKCVWLQPPVTSSKTRDLAKKHQLTFIEGQDIAQIARQL